MWRGGEGVPCPQLTLPPAKWPWGEGVFSIQGPGGRETFISIPDSAPPPPPEYMRIVNICHAVPSTLSDRRLLAQDIV